MPFNYLTYRKYLIVTSPSAVVRVTVPVSICVLVRCRRDTRSFPLCMRVELYMLIVHSDLFIRVSVTRYVNTTWQTSVVLR